MALQQVYRGTTFRRRVVISNTDENGDPWTFAMFSRVLWTLRTTPLSDPAADLTDTTAIYKLDSTDVGDSVIEVDPEDESAFFIRIDPEVTTTWSIGNFFYEIKGVIDGAVTDVYPLEAGAFRVLPDLGRRAP